MAKKPRITGKKQARKGKQETRTKGGQYLPGVSGNPAGRPKGSVDPLKEIGKKIAEERVSMGLTVKQRRQLMKMGVKVEDMTRVEAIMRDWASSENVMKQEKFIERTYGKVANVNVNQNSQFDFMKHANKFTDAELEAIRDGADPLEILFSKLPDVDMEEE